MRLILLCDTVEGERNYTTRKPLQIGIFLQNYVVTTIDSVPKQTHNLQYKFTHLKEIIPDTVIVI